MRLSARVLFVLQSMLRFVWKASFAMLSCLLFFTIIAAPVAAQTSSSSYIDPNVPRNQHNNIQIMLIETSSVILCQLAGVDVLNPSKGCLGLNPTTGKIGYVPPTPNKLGGLVGMSTDMIAGLYRPVTSSDVYFKDVASNFGIVKQANAYKAPANGWEGLRPILEIWKVVRNAAYFVLILAFIFIGLAIMLRVKIDPRTVMTIQNQIPRIIVSIILITFSYAIAATMIDFMWIGTYAGINMLTNTAGDKTNPVINVSRDGSHKTTLAEKASTTLLQTPIVYFNQIFRVDDSQNKNAKNSNNDTICDDDMGLCVVSEKTAFALGGVVRDTIQELFVTPEEKKYNCISWKGIFSFLTPGKDGPGIMACVGAAVSGVIGFLTAIVTLIIIFAALLLTLFKVWWTLLKAFIYVIVYTVVGPVWIALGLLPQKPLGFEKWMRAMFVNIAVFPATVFLFVFARLFFQLYDSSAPDAQQFTPPLIGNPNMTDFGVLISFGMILMAPQVLKALQDSMKVGENKYGQVIPQTINQVRGVTGAGSKRVWGAWTRKDQQGNPAGPLSLLRHNMTSRVISRGATMPGAIGSLAKRFGQQRENERVGKGRFSENQLDKQYRLEKKLADASGASANFPKSRKEWDAERQRRNYHNYSGHDEQDSSQGETPKTTEGQTAAANAGEPRRVKDSEGRQRKFNELTVGNLTVGQATFGNNPQERGVAATEQARNNTATEAINPDMVKDFTKKIADIDRGFLADNKPLEEHTSKMSQPEIAGHKALASTISTSDPQEYRAAMQELEPDTTKREQIMAHDLSQFNAAKARSVPAGFQIQMGREGDMLHYRTSVPVDLNQAEGDEASIREDYRQIVRAPGEANLTAEDKHVLGISQQPGAQMPQLHTVKLTSPTGSQGGSSSGGNSGGSTDVRRQFEAPTVRADIRTSAAEAARFIALQGRGPSFSTPQSDAQRLPDFTTTTSPAGEVQPETQAGSETEATQQTATTEQATSERTSPAAQGNDRSEETLRQLAADKARAEVADIRAGVRREINQDAVQENNNPRPFGTRLPGR